MILLGDSIDAEKALDWGLINFLVEDNKFEEKLQELALRLAKGAPIVQRVVKQAMNRGFDTSLEIGLTLERDAFGTIGPTADMQEGLKAKFERRDPVFEGK